MKLAGSEDIFSSNSSRSTLVSAAPTTATEWQHVNSELDALWRLLSLCAVSVFVVGHFAWWHLYHCVLRGETTVEYYSRYSQAKTLGHSLAQVSMLPPRV